MLGRSLAIEDSFFLQFRNNSGLDVPVSLFTLGSNSITGFTSGPYAQLNNTLFNTISFGVWNISSVVQIIDSNSVVISSVTMNPGDTLAQYMALVNPLIDSNGKTGSIYIQQNAADLSGKKYDVVVTGIGSVTFSSGGDGPFQLTAQTLSYVTSSPFVTVWSTVPINEIEQSEAGNAYRVLGIDLYGSSTDQLTQTMSFGRIDANGNAYSYDLVPTVDPYQYNRRSIHAVDAYGLIIDPQATFNYTVLSGCNVRLTFNYMKAQIRDIERFDQAFIQMIAMKFAAEQLALKLEAAPRELYLQ
jgi:hypothetical protein